MEQIVGVVLFTLTFMQSGQVIPHTVQVRNLDDCMKLAYQFNTQQTPDYGHEQGVVGYGAGCVIRQEQEN
jgi:hypothetical protein